MRKTYSLFVPLSLILILFYLMGCSFSAIYKPPEQSDSMLNYSKIINKNFDETWASLIDYSASTFFGIENFEKESGLITLNFGASNPEEYITGGYWKYDYQWGANQLHFEGDYVEYSSIYLNGVLIGKMNIVVKEVDSSHTKVTVNAKYIFSADVLNENRVRTATNTWSFESGNCDELAIINPSKGTPPTRIICPTYKAEEAILDALE